MRQRRLAKLYLKAGFCITVSLRAFIILYPTDTSLAQNGTSPQRTMLNILSPSICRTIGTGCEGAML